jgi:hypothetical protein
MTGSPVLAPETPRELEAILRSRFQGRIRNLRVLIRPSGAVLQGSSPSWYVKQLAQHEFMTLSSLPIAANEIEVRRTPF